MLSKEAVEEFKKLHREHYGEELNDFVASEAANRLVRIIELVYKPISKEKYDEIRKEQETTSEEKKIDLVKHLVDDAKVTEFKEKIGEKRFWELVIEINSTKQKEEDKKK